jgi:hypothetical protein
MALHMIAYFQGPLFFANVINVFGFTFSYGQICIGVSILGAIYTVSLNILKVHRIYRKENEKFFAALTQFVPFIQILICLLGWPLMSPGVYERNAHFMMMGCGTLTAAIVGFLVVFRVTKQAYPLFHPILIPTLIPFALHFLANETAEEYYAVAFGVYGLAIYLYYAQKVLSEMSEIFHIDIFKIPEGGYEFNKKK